MALKFTVLLIGCIAVTKAGIIPAAAVTEVEEYDPHPQYTYGYDVKDALSGDSKTQVESRDGDVVQGQYSLNDADGYRRIVDYTSDPINGFNAVVRREPLVAAVAAAPVVGAPAHIIGTAPLVAAHSYAAVPAADLSASPPALTKTAPLVAAGPSIVKTRYASPLITYAY